MGARLHRLSASADRAGCFDGPVAVVVVGHLLGFRPDVFVTRSNKEVCVPSRWTASYSSCDISTFSTHVVFAHSQSHSPNGVASSVWFKRATALVELAEQALIARGSFVAIA
jgi:hypothetical protein